MKEHRSRPPERPARTTPADAPPAAETSPFETLGLAPTLDARQVRRAYYALLEQFPPQKDPEGFGRLRKAYEQLSNPVSLAAAFLTGPVNLDQEIARFEASFGQGRQEAASRLAAERRETEAQSLFLERFSRLPLSALRPG